MAGIARHPSWIDSGWVQRDGRVTPGLFRRSLAALPTRRSVEESSLEGR